MNQGSLPSQAAFPLHLGNSRHVGDAIIQIEADLTDFLQNGQFEPLNRSENAGHGRFNFSNNVSGLGGVGGGGPGGQFGNLNRTIEIGNSTMGNTQEAIDNGKKLIYVKFHI